jgi:cell surface protein SprA
LKRVIKYIVILSFCISGIFILNAGYSVSGVNVAGKRSSFFSQEKLQDTITNPKDSVLSQELKSKQDTAVTLRTPVKKTVPEGYEDLLNNSASDLRDPQNLKTSVEYDLKSGTYLIRSKVGDMDLITPLRMSPEEYQKYSMNQSLQQYFHDRNKAAIDSSLSTGKSGINQFNLMDMHLDIGGADRLFGPGGVRLRSSGSATIGLGLKTSKTDNPALPLRSRSRTFFDFNTDVQMNMRAQVGTKINFDLNYNTEAAFDFDASKLKLAYGGDEDEIIKSIEGGNVSMSTNNSLIRGGASLFGIKTDLQFGKLRIKALVAQQESESRTINSKGKTQMTPFEISVEKYDENHHYFLAQYFRDNYDKAMAKLPYISSAVSINRVEVWITNKSSNYGQARNIIAFTDLGEHKIISNPQFTPSGNIDIPYNDANTLYKTIVNNYPGARDISTVSQTFEGFIEGGKDYEKVENARLLSSSEYTINKQLGYISVTQKLQTDEVLAVAFEYTYNGLVYQVGEFSSDNNEKTTESLYLKMLKGTSVSPSMPFWDLMMKNIYSLGAFSIQKEKFRLDIVYKSDTAGTYIYSIPEGNIKDKTLLRVMNLDRLNLNEEAYPDGFFDYVEGYTVLSNNGKIIFPVVEPFGSHLREMIGDDRIADKYVYQELYDSTLTIAKQIAEKNKFLLRGQYTGSSSNVLQLGATNVARGSVVVKANGIILTENVDYIVNYSSGTVSILNENLLSSNANISVLLENQSTFNTQRKTMFGADLNYEFSKNFNLGATVMHLSEMPLTTKTAFGDESVKNTLWGLNFDYKGQSQWLTNMFDKLPLLQLSQPSTFSINGEFAYLQAGHYENKYAGEYSYLDDFESTQSTFDLLNPYFWNLASTPYDNNPSTALFPEAGKTNNIDYGKNRSLFAWYYIDRLYTARRSSLRPSYMTDEDISNHYVRAVLTTELFPERDLGYNEDNYLNILNLAYYPNERGPYNLDADNINSDGTLKDPEKRWGGMMRNLDQTDFEAANIQYIEFWIMDPFIYNPTSKGGDLYFNLGEISEDVLKDGKKFFENGLPINGDISQVDTTVWGKTPRQQSTVYAFDNTPGARALQDVGFNGISSLEERSGNGQFPAYDEFLNKLASNLSQETLLNMRNDPFSPLNDPATDDYHHYRGADYDEQRLDILSRYKRYNGTEGNSRESEQRNDIYDTSSKMVPDVEDFNQDNTLNENEKYFQYKVSIRPEDLVVGSNHVVDRRTTNVKLPNGVREDVNWYQFKIPIREYEKTVGSINDFSSIRFMRTFMTDFNETTILRFGKFALVRGEWRQYQQPLYKSASAPSITASMAVSTVNIEENSRREPINYVLPPGVTRITDPSQPQIRQQNEQSLSLKITDLASQDARAIYKTTSFDLRQYKRIQLFVHAEKLVDDVNNLDNGDLSVFIRMGSDYRNNYYEYSVPLSLTPYGNNTRDAVWPQDNKLDFKLETFTDLKLRRNRAKSNGESGITYNTLFSDFDPDNNRNTISVIGNPSFSDVQVIMIGVMNNSKEIKSVEIWVNELRVTDYDESGGWAANTNANLAIADFATINASGHIETAGFGGLDQSVSERNIDDYSQFSVAATVQLGKFFPEKTRVSLPLYYAYSQEKIAPQYNPIDQDIVLKEALSNEHTKAGKDSIRAFSNDVVTTKALALNNVRLDIRSKMPMPYDPANFSFGYASNTEIRTNPETVYETTKDYQGNLGYTYNPYAKPLKPFAKVKDKSYTKYIKNFALSYLPSAFSFQNTVTRHYYEIQLRDLNDIGNTTSIPVSFSQNFFWDRAFEVRWNPLTNISLDFRSGTNARIEEPYMQVNKKLNPDQYQVWKDSVKKSIADLGTPLKYDQNFSLTYTPPFQYIPILNWINGSVSYVATYNWEKGAFIDAETNIGNSIKNQRVMDFQGTFNFLSLYNKNEFLKKINQKSTARNTSSTLPGGQKRPAVSKAPKKKPKFETVVKLDLDSGAIVQHNMLTKKVLITARRTDDSSKYKVTYKALDYARIRITNKDTVSLKVTIIPMPDKEETFLYKLAEYSARTFMMLRSANFQYSQTDGMMLPGFRPEIGDWFGQGPSSAGNAPGWGFAFGDVQRSYIDKASDNGWFQKNSDNITPAMINSAKTLMGTALLEPIAGLKINLNSSYMNSKDNEILYMYSGMPETRSGTFTMSTIGLGGIFKSAGDANNNYNSNVFNKMLENRNIVSARINDKYSGSKYPDAGFLAGTNFAGQEYNNAVGSAGLNSSDVLIPAFIAAYTNKNPKKVGLTAFPSILSALPNWAITYDGLIKLPFVNKHFRSVSLSHRYSGIYSVGGYTSYLNWVNADIGGDLGYVKNTETDAPVPSMGYEIASVTLQESFNPLFGLDATFLNNVTAGAKYNKNRTSNLNVSSYQLVEALTDDITVSLGYKYAEFNKVLKLKKKSDFSNDLTVRMDYSYRKMLSLIRKFDDGFTQATQGTVTSAIQFSADYGFSKKVTLRGFYDLQINRPLVSSSAYPTSNSSYGISIQVSLDQ